MSPTEFRVGPCRSHRLFESLAVRRGLRFVQARAAPNIESALSSLRGTLFPGGSTFRPATEYAKKHRSHDSETVTWSVAGSRVLVVLLQRNLAAKNSLESSSGNSSTNESNPEIYRVRRGLAGSRQLLRFIDGCPDRDEAGLLRRKYPSSDRADLFDFETPAVSPGPSRGRKISANWSYSSLVENTKSRPSGLRRTPFRTQSIPWDPKKSIKFWRVSFVEDPDSLSNRRPCRYLQEKFLRFCCLSRGHFFLVLS